MTATIVGAGFAGLRSAMLLNRAGWSVRVVEARSRIGGRAWTERFGTGEEYESGAEWIDADHYRVLRLLEEFGLTPAVEDLGPRRFSYLGETIGEDEWPGFPTIEDQFFDGLSNAPTVRTLQDYVAKFPLSPRDRWRLTTELMSDEGDSLDRIGFAEWRKTVALYEAREGGEVSAWRFPGGVTRILEAMAATLPQPPETRVTVRRIDADGTVTTDEDTWQSDAVIVTPPPAVLASIELPVAMPALPMSRTVKLAIRYERAWWHPAGGRLQTDGPATQLWPAAGGIPVLIAYLYGDDAEATVQAEDPGARVREGIESRLPESRGLWIEAKLIDWIHDPFALGGFSLRPPDLEFRLLPPAGRIHWAGEWTADWFGFVEGALESAERVTAEIAARTA
jgi:monoamine oxidase